MTAEAPAIRVMRMFIESSSQGNPELHRLLEISLLRIVRKATKRPSASLSPFFELDHVVDWLKAALVNGAPWLRNLDAHGRPKKLVKFGSLDAMKREADRDMLRWWSQKVLRRDLPENSEEIVATLEQGYTMVRLLSVEALDAETTEMQHCVGQGAYDEALADGKTVLLSLRDEHGKAHATIEVCDGLVRQVQGKQNKPPKFKYIPLIMSYFRQTDFNWSLFGNGAEGFVIDIHGTIHSNDELPDELHAHGALFLRSVAKMPSLVRATTDVTVHCLAGEKTPLRIEGRDIVLIGPGFTTCPALVLTGDLRLDDTKITTLPERLSVRSLRVRRTPLASFPADFRCTSSIALISTEVTSLPSTLWEVENGKVSSYGTVDLRGSPISDLGGLNHVNGSLRLGGTKIDALPPGFHVAGELDIEELNRIVIGEDVYADRLVAYETGSIFFLGDILDLGDIHLAACGVSFPPAVKSRDSITLIRCGVELMPERIECQGKLDLANSQSNDLPKFIRAKQVWIADWHNWSGAPLTALEGDLEAEIIALQDRHIRIGDGVKADTVAVFPTVHRYVEMPISDAREYLAFDAGTEFGAIDKFGRGRSVSMPFDFLDSLLPSAIEKKIGIGGSLYGFGSAR